MYRINLAPPNLSGTFNPEPYKWFSIKMMIFFIVTEILNNDIEIQPHNPKIYNADTITLAAPLILT